MARAWLGGLVLAGALLLAGPAFAQDQPAKEEIPVLLLADEVTYDRELGVITARGNVEISKGDSVVHADTVSYNEKAETVTASGNVSLTDESGNTVFADYVELTRDLKQAAIESIRMLLADKSRLAAASGRRTGGTVNELDRAVYSPCLPCAEDPMRAPLWQIKAVKVRYDEAEHRIEYEDAWLEFFGVPVAYTPYFSHSDGTVKRESGFLTPEFGYSSKLGGHMQVPYFWAIDTDKDLTFAPIFSTNEYPVAFATYRQRVQDGEFSISASATVTDENDPTAGLRQGDFRGHVDAIGRFDVDENWRWGFDLERATDKTYERLFDFSKERSLTSRAYIERFVGRSYGVIQGYAFQGTRDIDINDQAPIVAPLASYSWVGEPFNFGGYFTFDANAMVLSRIDGRDVDRFSVEGGWRLPYTSPWGDVTTLSAMVRGDVYAFNDFDPANPDILDPANGDSGVSARLFPQVALEWRYPFVRDHDGWQEVLEPIASVVAAPNKSNFGDIPNEDSLDIEFDDTVLFDPNRFAGLDRVDTGQRANFGLRWSFATDGGGSGSVFVGQSYQFDDNVNFGAGSGLEDNLSDIIGSVRLTPIDEFDLLYRFRFDTNSLSPRRQEVLLKAGPPLLNLDLSYAFLAEEADPDTDFGDRQEINGKLSSQFTDYWSGYIAGRYDIESDRVLSYGFGIEYEDECFDVRVTVERDEFDDQERNPDWKAKLSIGLKNLGFGEDGS